MAHKVADQFAEVLVAAGVKRIYGIVGDSLNGLTDSLRRQCKIEWIHVQHEEAAAFAAAGEAHLTGELAVCAGSCGPGNLHLINGLFDAHRSRVPVLAIAAQFPSGEIDSGYFQETHPQDTFKECSHFCELISSANQMPRTLEMAIHAAFSKRGVAVVGIPGDVALQSALEARVPKEPGLLPAEPSASPANADLDRLAALLNSDARVTMLCGSGCQGAHKHILSLAERLKAPIVHALKGKEHVEWDNPYDVGMTGLIGFSSGYYAMLDCDILLMLGNDFPYRQFYPSGDAVRIAQVDQRGEVIGRRAPVDVVWWVMCARRSMRCSRASKRRATLNILSKRASTITRREGAWMSLRSAEPANPQSIPSKSPRRSRFGIRRRNLHLRRRPTDGMGRPVLGNERKAADRIVLASMRLLRRRAREGFRFKRS
jgi:pyruvate dehydrogenase (quinone)